jgi:chaperonin GroES
MGARGSDDGLPIRLLHDRVLVQVETEDGDRRSAGGILIPATAQVGRRLVWGGVAAVGSGVRSIEVGDRVLFDPQERAEVELHARSYIMLRERDVHAVAAQRIEEGAPGLYL